MLMIAGLIFLFMGNFPLAALFFLISMLGEV